VKILIIGGCGYVGSALFAHLTDCGHDVQTVDTEERGNRTNPENVKCSCSATRAFDFEEIEAVIWVAGRSSVRRAVAEPARAVRENVSELADVTRRLTGQPLLFASSASVLSRDLGGPSNIYDLTKIAAEMLIPPIYENTYVLRFGTVCGAAPNLRPDMVIQAMVKSALETGVVHASNLEAMRPILGVRDLCSGVEGLLGGGVEPGIINLVSFNAQIGKLANFVAARLNARIETHDPTPTYDFTMEPTYIPGFPPVDTPASIVDGLVELHREQPLGSFAP